VCKKSIKNSQPFVKKMKNVRTPQGEIFLAHTVHCIVVGLLQYTTGQSKPVLGG